MGTRHAFFSITFPSIFLGWTELCHEVWNRRPPKPQSSATKTTLWHSSIARAIHVLRSCGPATEPENPQSPKIRKKYEIPHPGLAPENTEKIPKKYENGPENGNFWAVFVFFRYFFRISGGQPGVGDLVVFSYFRGLGVFGLCSRPAGSQSMYQWQSWGKLL